MNIPGRRMQRLRVSSPCGYDAKSPLDSPPCLAPFRPDSPELMFNLELQPTSPPGSLQLPKQSPRHLIPAPPRLDHHSPTQKAVLRAMSIPRLNMPLRIGSHEVEVYTPKQTPRDTEIELKLETGLFDDTTSNSSASATSKRPSKTEKLGLSHFNILGRIGEGHFATVFLVEHINTKMVYAMKVMKKTDLIKKKVVKSTRAERNVLVAIDHPFIVNLRYAFQTPTKLYLLMDFIPGGELFQRMPLVDPEVACRFYVAEIVLAIEHLHSHDIIYRDLKPENILINSDGHICIADLGLVKEHITDDSRTSSFCGTVHYMAPEVVKRPSYGKSSDWWALGCVAHELIMGNTPFRGTNKKKVMHNILTKKYIPPRHLRTSTQQFLKALLNRNIRKRLGCTSGGIEAIKNHDFFKGMDWDKLLQKKIDPPHKPNLASARDVSCFDKDITDKPFLNSPKTPEPESHQQDLFRGFSYTFSPDI